MIWIYVILAFTLTIAAETAISFFLYDFLHFNMCIEGCSADFANLSNTLTLLVLPAMCSTATFFLVKTKMKFKYWFLIVAMILLSSIIIDYLATGYGYAHTTDPLAP
ncbi:hypothetical protein LVJ85_10145 [Neisseria sp. Dent CA1/247]|uniref:hypothetical protein n=1 Tax=Neisseria sp. Dent CA1/247 TaxID=2912675 RepID=UPI001FD60FA5|nr:hypothetical protein [Neisseria sp. Dent CA1/247]UOO76375.1 hypothetical protein LVJ85_10145 [Neisseria sp. Dent CA1/247]